MGRIDDLSQNREFQALKEQVRQLVARSPMRNSAVSGGRTRFVGQNSFALEGSGSVDGTLTITGLEIVDGELRISGKLNVTGPTKLNGATDIGGDTKVTGKLDVNGPLNIAGKATINGDTTVTGPFHVDGSTDFDGDTTMRGPLHVDGATDINGDLDIDGNAKLNGNLNVQPGGYILVDDMTIGRIPGTSQAGIRFGIGQLRSTGDRTVLQSGDAIVGVRSNEAALLFGTLGIEVFSSGVYLQGVGFPPSGIQLFPVVTDSNGKLYRAPASN